MTGNSLDNDLAKAEAATAKHRLDVSMISWLETCALTEAGELAPSQEPLWMLAGFLRDQRSTA